MQYRTLGRTGLRVSDVGFGAMTIGGEIFGATDDQESLRALHRALDMGMNFIDTADAYGRGHSEELLAQVLKTRRKEAILATKGGNQFIVRQGLRNFDPDYITSALEASLKRLQIDTIDLYQLHNPSQEVMRHGEIFERLDRFKREGEDSLLWCLIGENRGRHRCYRNRETRYLASRLQHPAPRSRRQIVPTGPEREHRHPCPRPARTRYFVGPLQKYG